MYMSVSKTAVDGALVQARWHDLGVQDAALPAGTASVDGHGGDLHFALTTTRPADVADCAALPNLPSAWLLRVDEVAFPVGAVAHRHTHAGSGWRHLVSGALRIEAAQGTQIITPGQSWFEPAETPVRAVALQEAGVTRFVRCMVIPVAYADRSTFQLCDPADGQFPRLQVTHRHFDHDPQLDAG